MVLRFYFEAKNVLLSWTFSVVNYRQKVAKTKTYFIMKTEPQQKTCVLVFYHFVLKCSGSELKWFELTFKLFLNHILNNNTQNEPMVPYYYF